MTDELAHQVAPGIADVPTPMTETAAAPGLTDEREIQGNILRAFGGEVHAYVFVSFGSQRAGARRWLASAADRVATTEDAESRREPLMGIGLTATGLVTLHPELATDLFPFKAFWFGPLGNRLDDAGRITTTPTLLGDVGAAHPAKWVVGGPGGAPVDALLTIAADDKLALQQRVQEERRALAGAGLVVLHEQWGAVVRNATGQPAEHFGFAAGIGQSNVGDIASGEFLLGFTGERRPMNLGHRPASAAWMWGGSFQVFRRLRQDVAGWWAKMDDLRAGDESAEDVAARAMGRKLDGTALDLDFKNDPQGRKTPLYSHIRKMNPRHNQVFRDRSRRILRRGIPYGPAMDRSAPDDRDRGMLFNAYMASIEDQFEFLQRRWANEPASSATTLAKSGEEAGVDGFDPVIGDDPAVAERRFGKDAIKDVPPVAFGGFVTTTGSVYAFTPTRAALRLLSNESSL